MILKKKHCLILKTVVFKTEKEFPGGRVDRKPPANAETRVQPLVWEDSACHGAPVHKNIELVP